MTPREARLARGFTQAFVAFKSKVSAKTIHHAERTGLWPRNLSVRRRYGRTLGVLLKDMELQPPWAEQRGDGAAEDASGIVLAPAMAAEQGQEVP